MAQNARGHMPLRKKLLLAVGCAMVGLIVLISFVSKRLFLKSSLLLEEQGVRDHVGLVLDVLSAEMASMELIADDLGNRNDLCQSEDENEPCKKAGFTDDTLRALRLDCVLLIHTNGRPVYSRTPSLSHGIGKARSASLVQYLSSGKGPLVSGAVANRVEGFVMGSEGPMMITSRLVTAQGGGGAVRGRLVLGRFLNETELRRLSGITHLALQVDGFDPQRSRLDDSLRLELLRSPGAIAVRPRDSHEIVGYTCLKDVCGQPALVLQVVTDRKVYEHGVLNVRYEISLGFLLAGVVLVLVAFWLVERHVFSVSSESVTRLRKGIRNVATQGSLSGRIELQGADELAVLGGAINEMLQSLEAAQRQAELQQQELHQAHKLTALGTLVSGVAHEVNNPNTVVILNATTLGRLFEHIRPLLEEQYRRNPEFRLGVRRYAEVREEIPHLISAIQDCASRISALVGELKNFARRESSGLSEVVDMNAVVRSAILLMRHSIEKATEHFSEEYGERLPAVKGNAQRLGQVVVNLIQNACLALTSNRQAIRVITTSTADGKSVIVYVADEGRGIPSDLVDRITDPFFTTRREEGGTGLGLSVSLNIVKEHGGAMRFESKEGEGTTVTVTLPALEG
jgi:signal transduction histidine kinase